MSCFRRFHTVSCWPIVLNPTVSSQIVYLCRNWNARLLVLCIVEFIFKMAKRRADVALKHEILENYLALLRPSDSSRRVSRIPHALISAAPATQRKLLIAARRVVFAFELKARCRAVEVLSGLEHYAHPCNELHIELQRIKQAEREKTSRGDITPRNSKVGTVANVNVSLGWLYCCTKCAVGRSWSFVLKVVTWTRLLSHRENLTLFEKR